MHDKSLMKDYIQVWRCNTQVFSYIPFLIEKVIFKEKNENNSFLKDMQNLLVKKKKNYLSNHISLVMGCSWSHGGVSTGRPLPRERHGQEGCCCCLSWGPFLGGRAGKAEVSEV